MEIKVLKDILGANEQIAERNRRLLDSNAIFADYGGLPKNGWPLSLLPHVSYLDTALAIKSILVTL